MADSSRSAGQSGGAPADAAGVVFVHTNDPDANEIIAYRREGTGALVREAAYATQGAGGVQEGAPADPLASQHSLVHDERTGQLYVVNAGSDSLSVFGVDGARLQWRQTVPTDGEFPASVAVARGLVYVLNAGGDGGVSGYQVESDGLRPLPGSARRARCPTMRSRR